MGRWLWSIHNNARPAPSPADGADSISIKKKTFPAEEDCARITRELGVSPFLLSCSLFRFVIGYHCSLAYATRESARPRNTCVAGSSARTRMHDMRESLLTESGRCGWHVIGCRDRRRCPRVRVWAWRVTSNLSSTNGMAGFEWRALGSNELQPASGLG